MNVQKVNNLDGFGLTVTKAKKESWTNTIIVVAFSNKWGIVVSHKFKACEFI